MPRAFSPVVRATCTAVSGDLTPRAALVALIGGAAIEVRPQANGSIVLERTAANDPADAVEEVSDQQTGADPIQEQIVVTGSFIKRDSFSDIGSPVDVVDREMIDSFAPTGQLNDFLRFFPQNIGDYNFVLSDLASSTRFGGGEIDLRGLGGGSTLVLLNGRRQTRFTFSEEGAVDTNSLVPGIMVDRTEVLNDGASALYGTDAVGGVVNFITRDDFTGVELRADGRGTFGATNDPLDHNNFTIGALVGGSISDRLHIVAVAATLVVALTAALFLASTAAQALRRKGGP